VGRSHILAGRVNRTASVTVFEGHRQTAGQTNHGQGSKRRKREKGDEEVLDGLPDADDGWEYLENPEEEAAEQEADENPEAEDDQDGKATERYQKTVLLPRRFRRATVPARKKKTG